MGKVIKALLFVVAIWVGVEIFTQGPSHAFGGALAGFFSEETANSDTRSTAQRAGNSVSRARDRTDERRKKMLGE